MTAVVVSSEKLKESIVECEKYAGGSCDIIAETSIGGHLYLSAPKKRGGETVLTLGRPL